LFQACSPAARQSSISPANWSSDQPVLRQSRLRAKARHKKQKIREIMTHFPSRTFVFVGDSGEADPEVYREIKDDPKFGHRVQAIFIRTVTESKEGRLDGMQVIEARRVTRDVSEFDK
jgi:phosphatidate phosphatase APP1